MSAINTPDGTRATASTWGAPAVFSVTPEPETAGAPSCSEIIPPRAASCATRPDNGTEPAVSPDISPDITYAATSAIAPVATQIAALGKLLAGHGLTLGTAESCTGGLIAARCTDISGSSAWFSGGIVSYANSVKEAVLGVPADMLRTHGAVSEPVVLSMARGAQRVLGVDCAVAVSGVAGPTGGTPDKPVGTVWVAIAVPESLLPQGAEAECHHFSGKRGEVRDQTVYAAISRLLSLFSPEGTEADEGR